MENSKTKITSDLSVAITHYDIFLKEMEKIQDYNEWDEDRKEVLSNIIIPARGVQGLLRMLSDTKFLS